MALGRSNSLSLNTSAVNNSFAQSSQAATPAAPGTQTTFGASTQPPAATGLFGSTMNNTNTSGSLFGGAAPATTTASSGTSLFGGSLFNNAPKPATTNAGLFGSTPATTASSGGLFGAAPAPAASTGLFGASTQPAASGGLFGSSTAPKGGLFGGSSTSGGGLFGGAQPAQPSGGLFGSQPAANNSLFGGSQAPNAQAQTQAQAPSLLSASRYGQPAPFTGRLSMGQGGAAQPAAAPATKLDWSNVKPVTRFADLVDSAKADLEAVDKVVAAQEQYARQIESFLAMHSQSMASLQPDIDLITEKCETAEQALIRDAQGIQHAKLLTQKDHLDIQRIERISENQRLPANYQYNPAAQAYQGRKGGSGADDEYDVNLVSNYFVPMAADMQKLLDAYTSNLGEIESHLATIEASAFAQSQALGQQRNGGSGPDAVRQLADTLRGFESTILNTAARVGAAREGVTNLSLSSHHGY